MNIVETTDHEYAILENIYNSSRQQSSSIKQRDLARIVGISLGMTNSVIKRLAQMGWVTIRRINSRNIQYIISAEGIEEIARRSYRFLKRTIKNIVLYRETVQHFLLAVQKNDFKELVLVGPSDLDFIIEDACSKMQLRFSRSRTIQDREGCFYLYSEAQTRKGGAGGSSMENCIAFLNDILIGL
jgi:DNA-binding MarR family transcriptional regulator